MNLQNFRLFSTMIIALSVMAPSTADPCFIEVDAQIKKVASATELSKSDAALRESKLEQKAKLNELEYVPDTDETYYQWCMGRHNCFVIRRGSSYAKWSQEISNATIESRLKEGGFNFSRVTESQFPQANSPYINCHATACLINKVPGIEPDVWINGDSLLGDKNELSVLLELFFEPVVSTKVGSNLGRNLAEGDFITFIDIDGTYVHSGVLTKSQGDSEPLWIRSKFGEAGMYDTPIDAATYYYDYFNKFASDRIQEIQVWRKKW